MEDCIFCKLVRKEVPSNIVFEDENVVSFLELNQSAPGHVMVILKKHGLSILDYDENDLGKLMVGVKTTAKKVQKAMNADSLTIGINHMEKRGAPHLHVHIIPRHVNDKGGIIQSIVRAPVNETREQIAEKIRNEN
jgi:histidine triad (HIT) family protein